MFAEGMYKVRSTAWGWTETSNNYPQFWMAFEVLGLADKNDLKDELKPCEPGSGRWTITPSTDKSEDWLIGTVQHLGYDRDDLLGLDPDSEGAFNFEGTEFFASCKHEEYQGVTREKWTAHTPSRPKLATDKFLALNERMGHKVKEMKARRNARDGNPVVNAAPAVNTEALPF